MRIHESGQIVMPLQLRLLDFVILELLIFKVIFVADNNGLNFIMRVVFDFEEPFVKILETVPFRQVEHKKCCN